VAKRFVNLFPSTANKGQHRSYALKHLFGELGEEAFNAQITNSFTIGIFDRMPKQVSCFISQVGGERDPLNIC
jgi:hypothetical protein